MVFTNARIALDSIAFHDPIALPKTQITIDTLPATSVT
jgi:hypothetical protein